MNETTIEEKAVNFLSFCSGGCGGRSAPTYKGFHKDLTCRDMQYQLGGTYTTDEAKVCYTGFHACRNPIECLDYYPPNDSVYCAVEQSGELSFSPEDSKVASTEITIGDQLDVDDLIAAQKAYLENNPNTQVLDCNLDAPAIATQDYSICTVGLGGIAAGKDYSFIFTDHWGIAAAKDYSVVKGWANTVVIADGYSIARGGYESVAIAHARSYSITEDWGIAVSEEMGNSKAGFQGYAITGIDGYAESGNQGITIGKKRSVVRAGDQGIAVGGKDVTVGEGGVGVVREKAGCARGGMGAVLIFVEMDREEGEIKDKKVIIIDGEEYKEGVYYRMVGGEIMEDRLYQEKKKKLWRW